LKACTLSWWRSHNVYKGIASYNSGRRKNTAPGWALGGVPGEIEKPASVRGLFKLCGEHGSYFGAANSFAKLHSDRAVTTKAKRSNVIEVALAAPFCYGQNMISIP
jgi:hypothetical protein